MHGRCFANHASAVLKSGIGPTVRLRRFRDATAEPLSHALLARRLLLRRHYFEAARKIATGAANIATEAAGQGVASSCGG